MKKKFQVFISSTFTDLIEERQQAVKAVLDSNHIPAGMELFKANNRDQMDVIKQWIDESDIFMLILGGRYGSLDPTSQKSYTHLEYEYALEKGMPIFTLVLSENMIKEKFSQSSRPFSDFLEEKNPDKHATFLGQVKTGSVVRFLESIYQIDSAVMSSLKNFESDPNIEGWIRTTDTSYVNTSSTQKIEQLENEIFKLRSMNESLNILKNQSYTFDSSNISLVLQNNMKKAISDAASTILSIRDIRKYTLLDKDSVDMIELLKDTKIQDVLSQGVHTTGDSRTVLEISVLHIVIPFLEQHKLVNQTFEYGDRKAITYQVNSLGSRFFEIITE